MLTKLSQRERSGSEAPAIVVEGDGDGSRAAIRLPLGWTRIGRSAAADVRLEDPSVSRCHALLVRTDEDVQVLDDRSLDGLRVNGKRVEWAHLEPGDEVEVGRFRLRLLAAEATARARLAAGLH